MTENQPDFIYRLVTLSEWRAAQKQGVAPLREIDRIDGYMHLSMRDQVLETANLHFAGAEDLLALEVPFEGVAAEVKFELAPKRGELFPHLYGALRYEHVGRALKLEKTENGFVFGDAL